MSRISPEKRIGAIVRAVPALPEPWTLVVAGPESDAAHAADLRAAADPARARFVGVVDAGAALRAADVLVSASPSEGFGLAIAEAWLLGVPVAAVPAGLAAGEPDLCEPIPPDAPPDAVARAILAARESRFSGRIFRARERARKKNAPAKFAGAWGDLLATLAGRTPPRRRPCGCGG